MKQHFPQPFKAPNGYYYFYIYIDNKRQPKKSTGCRTKQEAREYIAQFMNRMQENTHSLREYCEPYFVWETCPIVRYRTDNGESIGQAHVYNQRKQLEKYIFPHAIAKKSLCDLTRGDLIDARSELTVNAFKAIKAILKMAFIRGDLKYDITSAVGIRKVKPEQEQNPDNASEIFSADEINRLFDPQLNFFTHTMARIAFLLAVEAGLRKGEILALHPADIDFQKKYIHIQRAWKSWSKRIIGLPKWNKKRFVPVSHTLEQELKAHIQTLPADCPFVICHTDQAPVSYKAYYRWYEAAFRKASQKLDNTGKPWLEKKDRKPHCFRHTFITRMEQAGLPRKVLQAIAGHSNDKTTEGYIHYEPAFLVETFRQAASGAV